jgi:cyclopropane fatty-acyl-phospholipid synthase-like methyltransferase
MHTRSARRIPTGPNYRYPSKLAESVITAVFGVSIRERTIGLQFKEKIVEVGSGPYVCTIAPPSLVRLFLLLLRPDYRLPSYFTKGFWCCENGKLYDFLKLLRTQKRSPLVAWFELFNNGNPIRDQIIYRLFPLKVKENIATHYNTSAEFMKLILGDHLEYTCAFFDNDHTTLEAAQKNKINTVIHRLDLSKEHHVLDMGCGWGQIAEAVARQVGSRVTGINLSEKQVEYAKTNQQSPLVDFVLTDYESFEALNRYDRIYSIGMLEHVGRGQLDAYFNKISELMAPGGRALVHCIVRRRKGSTNSWIDREVFPGAYIPELSDIIEHVDRSELRIDRIFTHDEHNYFKTLLAWTENFHKNGRQLEDVLAKFVPQTDLDMIMRIWEFYLDGSRLAFDSQVGYCYNVQILLRH